MQAFTSAEGEGLSLRLARHVAETSPQSLPSTSLAAAKRALMDGVGVMLGASGSPEAAPFVALARESPAGSRGATILGHNFTATPAAAAMANGAMAHVLDFEDAFDPAPCHPNASLLPAALAVAESRGGVSGAELLASIAIGCDLVCRVSLSLTRSMEEGGWYPPPILGALGATAAASRLMGLDARGVLDAWSISIAQNACPGEIKYSPASVMRAVREAFPAQSAVNAAMLASRGVRGFDHPLEGKAGFFRLFADGQYDEQVLLDGLGSDYLVEQLTFKAWPSCRGTHGYIEAVERIRAGRQVDWQDVESVQLSGAGLHRMLVEPDSSKRNPQTSIDAKFSLPFTVASALVRGAVDLDSFAPQNLTDPATLAMAGRISWEEDPAWNGRPAGGLVRLFMANGERVEEAVGEARGHPGAPLSERSLQEKFLQCAGLAPTPAPFGSPEAVASWAGQIVQSRDVREVVESLC